MHPLLKEDAQVVCLIKPQFEAGREEVGKKGVVRDPKVHLEVLERFLEFVPTVGYTAMGLDFSPIKGPEGNIEYLLYLSHDPKEDRSPDIRDSISDLVEKTHEEFLRNSHQILLLSC